MTDSRPAGGAILKVVSYKSPPLGLLLRFQKMNLIILTILTKFQESSDYNKKMAKSHL